MSALLTLVQLRKAMPNLDLEAALAEGGLEAIGLRNGHKLEPIPREVWAYYRLAENFDGSAVFANPHDDSPKAAIALANMLAMLKLRGLEDRLRPELRGEGGQVFWTALRFEIVEKPVQKKFSALLIAVEEALRKLFGANRPPFSVEGIIPTAREFDSLGIPNQPQM
jgi:hypothetical protein